MSSLELPSVTSARAADIVGLGYEGFRSYLKRGLLGRTGMLPGFHAPGSDSFDDPAPRAGWKRFGATDLCLMRVAKILMDHGFNFTQASSIVSRHKLWSDIQHSDAPVDRYLMVWPPYADHIFYELSDLHHLPRDLQALSAEGPVTLVNIGDVQRYVAAELTSADPS